MKRIILICLAFSLTLLGCDIDRREKEVERKTQELTQKEEELRARELALTQKEEQLATQAKNEDSTRQDSSFIYDPRLIGLWSVTMTCTETTCPGSAVGDRKTEQWEISYQGDSIQAKAIAGGQITRVYSGIYTGNTLELVEARPAGPGTPATKMIVRLRMTSERTMEGQRDIIRDGDCKIIYALSLAK